MDFAPVLASPSLSVEGGNPQSMMAYGEENFSLGLSAPTIYGDSLGKRAVDTFPAIIALKPGSVEQKYTRRVGLAVFVAFRDEANESKISFKLVESFDG